jgi:hypothetical protein
MPRLVYPGLSTSLRYFVWVGKNRNIPRLWLILVVHFWLGAPSVFGLVKPGLSTTITYLIIVKKIGVILNNG